MAKKRVSIRISPDTAKTGMLTVMSVLVFGVMLESAARSAIIQSLVPIQALGTNHIQFEYKLQQLDNLIEREGAIDCFFLGNSSVRRDIDPALFNQSFKDATGEEIRCFNFGLSASNLPSNIYLAQLLISQYHPKVLIFGVNYGDFSKYVIDHPKWRFSENPWIRYKLGTHSIAGWLTEHSFAFRLLLLVSYGADDGLTFQSTSERITKEVIEWTPYGYGYTNDKLGNIEKLTLDEKDKYFTRLFGQLQVSSKISSLISELVELKINNGIQIIIFELPYHDSLRSMFSDEDSYKDKENDYLRYTLKIQNIIENQMIPQQISFIPTSQLEIIPGEGWEDPIHLNYSGAKVFSTWLGEHIASLSFINDN